MRKSSYKIEQENKIGEGMRKGLKFGKSGSAHYNDVIDAFIEGKTKKDARMSTDGQTLYSYNTAIAKKEHDGTIIINNTKYSRTTQKQVEQLEEKLKYHKIPRAYTGEKDFGYGFQDFDFQEGNALHKKIARDR